MVLHFWLEDPFRTDVKKQKKKDTFFRRFFFLLCFPWSWRRAFLAERSRRNVVLLEHRKKMTCPFSSFTRQNNSNKPNNMGNNNDKRVVAIIIIFHLVTVWLLVPHSLLVRSPYFFDTENIYIYIQWWMLVILLFDTCVGLQYLSFLPVSTNNPCPSW